MRFFIVCDELEIVEIVLVESRVDEILLCELLQRLLVEDVLEMFELRRLASPVR